MRRHGNTTHHPICDCGRNGTAFRWISASLQPEGLLCLCLSMLAPPPLQQIRSVGSDEGRKVCLLLYLFSSGNKHGDISSQVFGCLHFHTAHMTDGVRLKALHSGLIQTGRATAGVSTSLDSAVDHLWSLGWTRRPRPPEWFQHLCSTGMRLFSINLAVPLFEGGSSVCQLFKYFLLEKWQKLTQTAPSGFQYPPQPGGAHGQRTGSRLESLRGV